MTSGDAMSWIVSIYSLFHLAYYPLLEMIGPSFWFKVKPTSSPTLLLTFSSIIFRLIACSTAGRSYAPEKVTVTDLFYLRGMDVGSVNIPYLLARYLRLFASGRDQGAMISGGQFVAHLADHFGLLTKERL
ncbi:hypothetical protein Tco_0445034 [Tanacetum coccineum]